jgi:aspartyl-tRNA(Asn)/glutamyl-tRNA(Gln) amidotransferase subunit A
MKIPRRHFLRLAGTAAAVVASPAIVRAQAPLPTPGIGPQPPRRSARDHLEEALARIADPMGEGSRACLTVYAQAARAAADGSDGRARAGISLGPLDGAIVTIKDLFDVAGEPTRAGSKVLAEEAKPAAADAVVVRRLRAAGAVIVAKNNMAEFAYSGIGENPHFGTPGNPADRTRAPGGSSSGGAVAAADGMCDIAIGSDTGGSVRVPAAFCGVVGFKPSKYRVPTEGAYPLSFTQDSIGPLARTVALCADADAVLAGDEPRELNPVSLGGLRIGIVQGRPLTALDETVAARFRDALGALDKANVRLSLELLPLLDDMQRANAKGGIVQAEALAINGDLLARRAADIDPDVRAALERGKSMSGVDYVKVARARAELVRAIDIWMDDFDAVIMPTTPIVAPRLAEVATPETFAAKNQLALRNAAIVNFFDLCAVSLPMVREGELPVGLMFVARNGHDRRLLNIAASVEKLFAA